MAYTPSCMHMALLQALSILLLASMLVPGPGSAEEAPSGYRIEPAMLSATDGTNSPASSGTYKFALQNSSSHEYLMELKMGTETFLAVADTGSDLVWTKQLKLCASSTFTHGSCSCSDSTPNCKSCPAGAMCGTCFDELCMFKKKYGSNARTAKGFMGTETLTLSTDKKVPISFGCAIDWRNITKLPESADGIVGLNRGPLSFVKQLKVTKFSYCLNNQLQPELSSQLWFGDDLVLSGGAGGESGSSLQTTPLVKIKEIEQTSVMAYKYYVEPDCICINDKEEKCQSLQKGDIEFKSINDKGVMFIDSGAPRTQLHKTVFGVLKGLLAKVLKVQPHTKSFTKSTGKEKILTCFEPPAPHSEPEMVLNFTKGATMRLPWANYMDEAEAGLFCLTIHEAKEDSVISTKGILGMLGNFQQQNIHMLYDLTEEHEKLSFVQVDDCSTRRTKYI